jgi:hypothetical protein
MEPPRRPIGRARGRSTRDSTSSSMSESSMSAVPPVGRVPGRGTIMAPPGTPQVGGAGSANTQIMSSASSVSSSMDVYRQGEGRTAGHRSDMSSICTRPQNLASKQGILKRNLSRYLLTFNLVSCTFWPIFCKNCNSWVYYVKLK